MKKWLKFFFLGFFSNKASREGAKRGYTNFMLGLILALAFIWAGFIGGEMLPFGPHYRNSPDFVATVRSVFANPDLTKRLDAEIEGGALKVKNQDGNYSPSLVVNTLESEEDKQKYSASGYNVIVDTRPADALAEIEAYCISNDGKDFVITYDEYLTLSSVARLNFDFKLKYTGRELELTDSLIEDYREYLVGLNEESKASAEGLAKDLSDGAITKSEYQRSVYELYFVSYYPEITAYESSSKVPLLRNYYYHQYISSGLKNYIFIFNDYMTASFETKGGTEVAFYGVFSDMENGALISEAMTQDEANSAADSFIKKCFGSIAPLTLYAYVVNVVYLIPFIALMPLVVTLLAYSILKLRGVESIKTFGSLFKILGSYVWFCGVISSVITVIISFFTKSGTMTALPLVFFFVALTVRSIIFAVDETKQYTKKLEEQETILTEA